ncbi:MAG: AAA family ATPase [Candidatus Bathyarchaeia archaeon]
MTYIKKIEIRGFKTFADKTTIVLDEGFTVITGPNGSGKTNIIDAILFGLGDLSARRLRAENFSKLLFQGNPNSNLKRKKKAKVTIQFDNSDGRIPVETSTVTVSREIDERGQSVYRLNGRRNSRANLMDVLSMAGVSPYGHNIVLQGTITRLAEISAHERRKMIEDMIGRAQYDAEKADAEEKLKEADISIRTAMGQVGEVQRRVEALERERNDLLRFNFIRNEIRRLEAVKVSNELTETERSIRSLSPKVQDLERRVEKLNEMRERLRSKRYEAEAEWRKLGSDRIEEGQTQVLQLQIQLGDLRSRLSELSTKIDSETATLEGLRRVKENTQEQIEVVKSEIRELRHRLGELTREDKRLLDEMAGKQSEYDAISTEASSLRSSLSENTQRIREIEDELEQLHRGLIDLRSEYARSRSTIRIYNQRLGDLQSRKNDLMSTLARLQKSLNELKEVRKEQRDRLKTLQRTLERRTVQKESIEREIKEAEKIAETAKEAVVEFSTQREFFEKIRSEENALKDMEELGELGVIEGVYGRLRRLIKIERGYEKAIEAASAGWLNALVVRDLDVAFTCSETLKRLKLGRIKIIPLRGLSPLNNTGTPAMEGIKGPASTFLRYAKNYQPAVHFVFGDTAVALNEKAALSASKRGIRSVTLNGDLYEVGGAVESGFYRAPIDFSSIVPSKSAVENLDRAVNALIDHLKRREEEITDVSNEIFQTRVEITRLTEAMNRLDGEIQRVRENIHRTNRNIKRAEKTIEGIQAALEKEQAQIGIYKLNRVKILSQERRLRRKLAVLRRKTDMAEIQAMEVERNKIGNEIMELREKLSAVEGEISTIKAKIESVLKTALKNTRIQLDKVTRQISSLQKEIERDLHERDEVDKRVKELEKKKETLSTTVLSAKDEAKKYVLQIGSIDEQLERLDREYDQATHLLHQLKLELQGLHLQMDLHLEKLRSLGYEEPLKVSKGDLREVESMLRMMRFELERIGAVNQLAEAQYAEQVSRYRELSIRMNELESEKMAIVKFIEEIERKKYKAFMDAFNKVNENLSRYFSKLTDGGDAALKLENPENPFSGGVDMVVQFPNKSPILISGASSGERSVSAAAFLFALQGITPASFYLFDEVDAHLDAFHVGKLGELLAEESAKSQFLVVTLKPEMVSKAEKIYGVYEVNGVSHVISTTFKGAA